MGVSCSASCIVERIVVTNKGKCNGYNIDSDDNDE